MAKREKGLNIELLTKVRASVTLKKKRLYEEQLYAIEGTAVSATLWIDDIETAKRIVRKIRLEMARTMSKNRDKKRREPGEIIV